MRCRDAAPFSFFVITNRKRRWWKESCTMLTKIIQVWWPLLFHHFNKYFVFQGNACPSSHFTTILPEGKRVCTISTKTLTRAVSRSSHPQWPSHLVSSCNPLFAFPLCWRVAMLEFVSFYSSRSSRVIFWFFARELYRLNSNSNMKKSQIILGLWKC